MSYPLVKILIDDDGTKVDKPKWCLVRDTCGSPATFCSGEVFGYGEGDAVYEQKTVERKGVTCPKCIEEIREIQKVIL